jgi:hypothetical protein
MPIANSCGFLYVHIPRTGGTSITLALRRCGVELQFCGRATPQEQDRFGYEHVWLHHMPADLLRRQLSDEGWETLFKFAFVRNPWDWAVSTYCYHREQVAAEAFRKEWPQIALSLEHHENFEEWVLHGMYMQDQTSFILDLHGQVLVDHIARFESLGEEFGAICRKFGLNCTLPTTNASEHGYYRDYYSHRMREEVGRRFQRDVMLFRYKF